MPYPIYKKKKTLCLTHIIFQYSFYLINWDKNNVILGLFGHFGFIFIKTINACEGKRQRKTYIAIHRKILFTVQQIMMEK